MTSIAKFAWVGLGFDYALSFAALFVDGRLGSVLSAAGLVVGIVACAAFVVGAVVEKKQKRKRAKR